MKERYFIVWHDLEGSHFVVRDTEGEARSFLVDEARGKSIHRYAWCTGFCVIKGTMVDIGQQVANPFRESK